MSIEIFGSKEYDSYGNIKTVKKSDGISIVEFEFYNRAKSLIPQNELDKIKKKLDKNKDEIICWSNNEFIKYGIFFTFYTSYNDSKQIDIHEYSMKLNLSHIYNLKSIYDKHHFLKFNLTEKELNILYTIDRNSWNTPKFSTGIFHDSFDSLIHYIISEKHLNNLDSKYIDLIKNIYSVIFKGREMPKTPDFKVYAKGYHNLQKVQYIMDVIEDRVNNINYRTVLFCLPDSTRSYCEYVIRTYDEKDPLYFEMDVGRLVCGENKDLLFLNTSDVEYDNGKIVVNRNVFGLLYRDKARVIISGQKVIPPMVYRFYNDRVLKYEDFDGDSGLSTDEVKILDQYRKILNNRKSIKMDNLTLSNNMIVLNNENFVIKFDNDFLDIVKNLGSIKKVLKGDDVRYNFNVFYEQLLDMSCLKIINMDNTSMNEYKLFTGTKFTLNDIPIVITKEDSRIKINGIFSRIADVQHILSRAICYTNVNDYNKYIKDVSYIGADWMKMISSGVMIHLSNPFYGIFRKTGNNSLEKVLLRFSLVRDAKRRQQIYLILNNERYPIKYKGKFKRYFNYPRLSLSLNELKNKLSECIENITDTSIINIVENAVEEANIIQKRGEDLIRETVKDINAKEGEYEINGYKMIGYMLVGKITNSKYFVNKSDLAVFKLNNGSWNRRCVVDDHSKQRIFEDRLANRLVNIYNEPRYIYTLH